MLWHAWFVLDMTQKSCGHFATLFQHCKHTKSWQSICRSHKMLLWYFSNVFSACIRMWQTHNVAIWSWQHHVLLGSGLGWNPGWWLQSRGWSHDGDRKLRPKLKPVASVLKFGKPKQNPVASKIIIWKSKSKPMNPDLKSVRPKPLALGFEAEAKDS